MPMSTHPDGHPLLDGARWHTPTPGQPTVCVVPGCTRVLGQQRVGDVEKSEDLGTVAGDAWPGVLVEGVDAVLSAQEDPAQAGALFEVLEAGQGPASAA